MQATTVKLDGALVRRLKSLKAPDQTLTGFVRDLLESEMRRRHLRESAEAYVEFLHAHPAEAEAMDAWSTAPLERSRKGRKAR